jgi:hypothetical protein
MSKLVDNGIADVSKLCVQLEIVHTFTFLLQNK